MKVHVTDTRVSVSQGLDDGIGLGIAYDVQSQIESELAECRRLTLNPDEARALSDSLLTAASRATWPPIDYSAYREGLVSNAVRRREVQAASRLRPSHTPGDP